MEDRAEAFLHRHQVGFPGFPKPPQKRRSSAPCTPTSRSIEEYNSECSVLASVWSRGCPRRTSEPADEEAALAALLGTV